MSEICSHIEDDDDAKSHLTCLQAAVHQTEYTVTSILKLHVTVFSILLILEVETAG